MTQWWSAFWRPGAKRARALRTILNLEYLEERNLLSGLVVVPSPNINGSILTAAAAIADNDIWAVGNTGVNTSSQATLVEHFNGSSWSVVPTPAVKGGSLGGVAGVAGNDVWAVGDQTAGNSTAPLIEHWNGTSWSVVAGAKLPKGSFLTGVAAVASNDVWAVGDQPGSSSIFDSFIEHWDGTSWSVVATPTFPNGSQLNGVSADSSNDVWAVGTANSVGLVEHWNGQTWSAMSVGQPPSPNSAGTAFNAVTALSPTDVWAVGTRPGPPPADIGPTIEHWNGTSWQFVAPAISAGRGVGIAAVSADNIWAIIGGGAEQWNGTSWSQIANPKGVHELDGVTALSDGMVVAVGVGTNNSAVIVSNQSSAAPAAVSAARVTTTAAPSGTMAAAVKPAPVDQSFTTPDRADQPASSVAAVGVGDNNSGVIPSNNAPSLAPAPAGPLPSAIGERTQPSNVPAGVANPLPDSAGAGSLSRIDAFYQAFDAMLRSLESRIEAMDPQSMAFFRVLNAEFGALEAGIAGHPLTI